MPFTCSHGLRNIEQVQSYRVIDIRAVKRAIALPLTGHDVKSASQTAIKLHVGERTGLQFQLKCTG